MDKTLPLEILSLPLSPLGGLKPPSAFNVSYDSFLSIVFMLL